MAVGTTKPGQRKGIFGLHYAWVIAFTSTIMMMVLPNIGYFYNVFLGVMIKDLGVSRAEVAGAASLGSLLG